MEHGEWYKRVHNIIMEKINRNLQLHHKLMTSFCLAAVMFHE